MRPYNQQSTLTPCNSNSNARIISQFQHGVLWAGPLAHPVLTAVSRGLTGPTHRIMIRSMRSRMLRVTAIIALIICIVCPVVEMFDHWDHTLQTGNDTEYTLVVLALCVGLAFSLARVYFGASRCWSVVASRIIPILSGYSERLQVIPFSTPAASLSPQILVLRV